MFKEESLLIQRRLLHMKLMNCGRRCQLRDISCASLNIHNQVFRIATTDANRVRTTRLFAVGEV
ncbi:hypothetical protein WG66_014936 [Moniliophthora roreri]|nr:hypothetical protein WG66_014936 [Moniliophthora roreri]